MNLYLISQDKNDGYDTYDSAVVVADNEEKARLTHPDSRGIKGVGLWITWTDPKNVAVELIGTAKPGTKAGVICASFNAG